MADFIIQPVNKREGQYYAPGSLEVVRKHSADSTAQVWVLSPRDLKKLSKALLQVLLDDD